MDLLQNWLLVALLAPTFIAIAGLLGSCLIGQKNYRAPADGAAGLLLICLLPILFVFVGGATSLTLSTPGGYTLVAVAASLVYAAHLVFYFCTLFRINDVSSAETYISLSVLLVPLFAWLLLDDALPPLYYLAFLIAATGVLLQCLPVIRAMSLSANNYQHHHKDDDDLPVNSASGTCIEDTPIISSDARIRHHLFPLYYKYFDPGCKAPATPGLAVSELPRHSDWL